MIAEEWARGNPSVAVIRRQAEHLVQAARDRGLVLTISLAPQQPLAMGRHQPVIELRPVRQSSDL